MYRLASIALVVAAAMASLAACGGGSSESGPSTPGGPATSASSSSSSATPPSSSAPQPGGDAGSPAAPASHGGVGLWSARLGGPQADMGLSVAATKAGGVAVVGSFEGTASVGGVPLASVGQVDFFVAKIDAAGAIAWVRPFGGPGNDVATSVALDATGNVYVAGTSDGALTLGGSSFGQTGGTGAFMLALDPYGNVSTASAYGGGAAGTAVEIAVANDGSIGLCGSYTGQIDLGGGPLAAAQGTYAGFVAKFDATATLSYAVPLGVAATATAQGLAFGDAGQLAVIGTFTGAGQFGTVTLTSAGDSDVFVAAFDPTGNSLVGKSFGGFGTDDGRAIAYDASGNLVAAGDFSDAVDFGTGAVTSQGALDAFLVKMTPGGVVSWAKTFGGPEVDVAAAVASDASGELLVTGEFEETMTVGSSTLTSAGDKDIFALKLSPAGTNVWSKSFGGVEADQGLGAAFDAQSHALVTGSFRTQVDFGTGMQTSAGDDDVFVAAFGP